MIPSVAFRGGETAGSIADRKIDTTRQETAGSVGVRHREQAPEGQIKTLDKDTVSFQGRDDNKKSSLSPLGKIIIGAGALAAAVGTMGLLHKHGQIDKLSDGRFKNFVVKYMSKPSYDTCHFVKKYATKAWEGITKIFKRGDGANSGGSTGGTT